MHERVNPSFDRLWLIPHAGRVLLHAPLRRISALVNRDAARRIVDVLESEAPSPPSDPGLNRLLEQLGNRAPTAPEAPPREITPRRLSLLLTGECNLRCVYCGVEAGSPASRTMTEEIAETAISRQADIVRRAGLGSLMLYYFGGEFSCAWETLLFCDRRGRELAAQLGVPFRSAATSNGVMPPGKARWIARHLDYIVVSMDGPAAVHDRLRPRAGGGPSHDAVVRSLRIFEEEGLPYALRVTADADSCPRLPEIVRMFCRSFKPVVINVEAVSETGSCRRSGCASPQPESWVRAVVDAGRIARESGIGLKLSMVRPEILCRSSCGVAGENFIVAADGTISSCFQVSRADHPLAEKWAFGGITPQGCAFDVGRLEGITASGVDSLRECDDCFARFHCAGGCIAMKADLPRFQAGAGCASIRTLTRWRILEQLRLPEEADRVRMDGADEDAFSLTLCRHRKAGAA